MGLFSPKPNFKQLIKQAEKERAAYNATRVRKSCSNCSYFSSITGNCNYCNKLTTPGNYCNNYWGK